ncbi:hypothetical protein FGIG_07658 [Fasciola gigantica]|uniref:Uncharacterized protein n=1 Tax=Fasciola gigantica TaxID=46835 RepID=A0A504YUQ9_FASGI|nr:hypothetical protein FGIG_07658 [Fasciola gigantica]
MRTVVSISARPPGKSRTKVEGSDSTRATIEANTRTTKTSAPKLRRSRRSLDATYSHGSTTRGRTQNEAYHDRRETTHQATSTAKQPRKHLGVILLDTLAELMTRGKHLPLGAVVVSYLEQTTTEHRPMGMFVKTGMEDNRWSRVPVTFEKEITYGIPPMILAYHPVSVAGGSFLGWYGADAMCREMAEQRLGITGFRVFLADQNLPLERVIPWPMFKVPVINLAVSWSNRIPAGIFSPILHSILRKSARLPHKMLR